MLFFMFIMLKVNLFQISCHFDDKEPGKGLHYRVDLIYVLVQAIKNAHSSSLTSLFPNSGTRG